ncbi:MAG TPA: NADH-quinone oxidoreductase subunit D [Dermatophilaceae bacterium]|nr:NADH-quinone oxidoreductase subunit D [Dermatophilaceae bacterium]
MPPAPVLEQLTAATGPVATAGLVDLPIRLPAGHPLGHGSLRLTLTVDGTTIVAADPQVGLVHRGAEKLFEVRDYRQILVLANRHDWLGPVVGELLIASVVEDALGLEVPERARWIRLALAELSRVTSHLTFLSALAGDGLPLAEPLERLVTLVAEVSGARMHHMIVQVGGLRADLPQGWVVRARHTVEAAQAEARERCAVFAGDEFRSRTTGLGVLNAETALAFGASGPMARASGVDLDLRRDDPRVGYAELVEARHVVTGSAGDVAARIDVLIDEVEVSLELVSRCLDRIEQLDGSVSVRLPKVLRVPEGDWYAALESPLGAAGCWLVSTGDKVPWRLALRTPSFAHVGLLAELLPGTDLADLATVLGSVFVVMGDVDK